MIGDEITKVVQYHLQLQLLMGCRILVQRNTFYLSCQVTGDCKGIGDASCLASIVEILNLMENDLSHIPRLISAPTRRWAS